MPLLLQKKCLCVYGDIRAEKLKLIIRSQVLVKLLSSMSGAHKRLIVYLWPLLYKGHLCVMAIILSSFGDLTFAPVTFPLIVIL